VRVKICGITRAEDAVLAAELGAWAVGFVFWPGSPRWLDAPAAAAIAAQLPPQVARVGVFVDQPPDEIQSTATMVGLTFVQLHGRERPEEARSLARPVIKAATLEQAQDDRTLLAWQDALLLVDGRDPQHPRADGRTVDWTAARQVAAKRAIVLAGGLTPRNVTDAIRTVRPAAVDVSSGVERAPGEKDPGLLRAFFTAVAAAEADPVSARSGDQGWM